MNESSANHIVGRDRVVARIWKILERKSIYMNDVRRIGKTQILRKMEAEPAGAWRVIHEDVEGVRSPEEFANLIYRKAFQALPRGKSLFRRAGELLNSLGGVSVGGVLTLPEGNKNFWKDLLERTLSDLEEACERDDEALVLLIDELPYMLHNMEDTDASEILDVLRKLSQGARRIKFIFTGSIGLHHVLSKLHDGGYLGSPLNHLELVVPGAIDHPDALEFAKTKVLEEDISCLDLDLFAEAIANSVGNIPFYIEKVATRLGLANENSAEAVSKVIDAALIDPNSGWDLEHYRKRLHIYYGEHERLAITILDHIARDGGRACPFDEIEHAVRGQAEDGSDEETIREIIKLLQRDFYLEKTERGYRFYLPLLCRWWQLDRDL